MKKKNSLQEFIKKNTPYIYNLFLTKIQYPYYSGKFENNTIYWFDYAKKEICNIKIELPIVVNLREESFVLMKQHKKWREEFKKEMARIFTKYLEEVNYV